MPNTVFVATAAVFGVAAWANGVFMLAAPMGWYFAVPGVTTTGPFNQHFIRDIGLMFLLVGTFFLAGATQRQHRLILWAAATIWLWGHALFHLWEVAVGICGPSALLRDFPAVSFPAIVSAALTSWAVGDVRRFEREQRRQIFFTTTHRKRSGELA